MKRSLMYFFAAALIVVILGAFAGWYVFVHKQIGATAVNDAGRGVTGSAFGSGASNIAGDTSFSSGGSAGTSASGTGRAAPRLWQVVTTPVAGFGFASTSINLYFVMTATGNVFEAEPAVSGTIRLTDTLIPKVHDALVAPDGALVMRMASGENIQTFAATLATTTPTVDSTSSPQHLQGLYLAQGISAIALAPKHQLLYLIPNPTGGSVLVQSDWNGGAQKKLFTSTLAEWQVSVGSDGAIVMTNAAMDDMPGFAYSVSAAGTLAPLVENVPGLLVLPRAGGMLLYSTSNGTPALYLQTSAKAGAQRLPLATSADKCVWAPDNAPVAYCAVPERLTTTSYLADRFLGSAHTIDAWYRIDAQTGSATAIYTPDPALSLDVETPTIDASGTYLAFKNAADQTLWMLRLSQ